MEEDFYSPSLMASLLSSGMQRLPTEQPVQAVPYYDGTLIRPRDLLSDETMMSPRDIAAVPEANAGVVSPFTTNPYMVVDYGKETNVPSFENTQNLDPTKTYTLTDPASGQVLAQSDPNDPTSLARLVQQANVLSGNQATRANWEVSQDGNVVASDYPNQSLLNAALPYLGAAIAAMGLAPFLGIGLPATGGAAGGAGAGAAGTAATGLGAGAGAGAAGTAAGLGAGTAAAGTAAGLAPLVGPGWTVLAPAATGLTTTGAVLGGSTLAAALAAAANAPGATSYANQMWGDQASAPTGGETNLSYVDPVTGDIVVPSGTTSFAMDPNSILAGFLGSFYPALTSVNIPPLAGTQLPELPPEEIPEGTGEDIVVEATNPPASLPDIFPPLTSVIIPPLAGTQFPNIPSGSAPSTVIPGVAPLPTTSAPTSPGTGTKQPSLLDQIIKYATIGGGVADLLGGSGGGTRQPVPSSVYGSLLGGVPNFGRGGFTPFTGDYEKYAFGPEWNFFGGAPAGTPTNG